MALAVPAQAEAPALCHGDTLDGWFVNQADRLPNGFVSYLSFRNKGSEKRLYLEHCASGQTLRIEYEDDWRNPSPVSNHFHDRITSKSKITQKQLASEVEAMGAQTKIWKAKVESCACHNLFPDAEGTKAPYVGEWQ